MVLTDTEKIIRKATGYKPTPGAPRQTQLEELVEAVDQLSPTKWDGLPNEAQSWANNANRALEKGEKIPEISTKPNGAIPVEPKVKKKKKVQKSVKPVRQRPIGAQGAIKRLVLKNPCITTDELLEQCAKQGFHPTKFAASTIRAGMRNTIKVIQEMGIDVRKLKLKRD